MTDKVTVTVSISSPWFSRSIAFDISDVAFMDTSRRLDHYKPRCDCSRDPVVEHLFCTSPKEIARTQKDREFLSKEAARIVETALMNILSENDTINGYPQEETAP